MSQRTIALPLFNDMDGTQVDLVALTLKVMIDRAKLGVSDEPGGRGDDGGDRFPDRTR